MAYVTEEIITKARIALKALNKEYGVKATLSGKGRSQMWLVISEGNIDFVNNYCDKIKADCGTCDEDRIAWAKRERNIGINHYYLEYSFTGIALEYLQKAKAIMHVDYWDKSDIQSDHFNCAFYVGMRVGEWNKPYKFNKN